MPEHVCVCVCCFILSLSVCVCTVCAGVCVRVCVCLTVWVCVYMLGGGVTAIEKTWVSVRCVKTTEKERV